MRTMFNRLFKTKEEKFQTPPQEYHNVIIIDEKKEREEREKVDRERINKIISYLSELTGEGVDYLREVAPLGVTEHFYRLGSSPGERPLVSLRTNYCIGIDFNYSSDLEIAKAFGNFIAGLGYTNGVVVRVNVEEK